MSETPPAIPGHKRFFAELKRRRVFRVMAVYGATGFVVLQVADLLAEGMGLPDVVLRTATFLVATLDTSTGHAALMSIPRNLLQVPLEPEYDLAFIDLEQQLIVDL